MRYELKPRSVSEILDGTFKLYRDNFGPLLGLGVIVTIPSLTFTAAIDWFTKAVKAGSLDAILVPLLILLALIPVIFFVSTIGYCALTSATIDAYLGRPFTVGGAIGKAFSLFFSLVWTGFLFFMGEVVGFILLIVPFIYLTLVWAVWLQAMVAEDKRGTAALARSYALTKGATGRLGWLLLVFVVLQLALSSGIRAAIPGTLEGIPFLGSMLGQLPSIFIAPVYPALLTLFYFDGRIRHEGFDLEMKAQEGLPTAGAALP